jgi:hypothetical protein
MDLKKMLWLVMWLRIGGRLLEDDSEALVSIKDGIFLDE